MVCVCFFFFFKQKTAYEMRISDWSSDVCSSDLVGLVNLHPYAAATKRMRGEEMTEIGMLAASGAVGFTDATRAIADPVVMRRLLSYASMFGKPVIQHPEEPSLAREGCATEGETATRLGLPGIPACAEVMMIDRKSTRLNSSP